MMNNLFNAIVIVALVGTFVMAPAPQSVPTAPRPTTSEPAISVDIPANQPPIPVLRSVRPMPTAIAGDRLNEAAPPPRGLDQAAAKAAIEAGGYRGVDVLARQPDGTWQAKAYRGATEVQVSVDGAGRVSTR